jgi:two-component system chemotaxis response regulator CheB
MGKYQVSKQYKAIVIGGSAGSFQGITKILSSLPEDFALPIILCLHRLKHVRNGFVEALSIRSTKPVVEPADKESIKRGQIYLASSNYHLSVELGNFFSLSTEEMVNNSRPSIDITLETSAYVYRQKLVGILLSGANRDGAWGMKRVRDLGGLTIVQDPQECVIDTMPTAALQLSDIDHTLKIDQIVELISELNKYY